MNLNQRTSEWYASHLFGREVDDTTIVHRLHEAQGRWNATAPTPCRAVRGQTHNRASDSRCFAYGCPSCWHDRLTRVMDALTRDPPGYVYLRTLRPVDRLTPKLVRAFTKPRSLNVWAWWLNVGYDDRLTEEMVGLFVSEQRVRPWGEYLPGLTAIDENGQTIGTIERREFRCASPARAEFLAALRHPTDIEQHVRHYSQNLIKGYAYGRSCVTSDGGSAPGSADLDIIPTSDGGFVHGVLGPRGPGD